MAEVQFQVKETFTFTAVRDQDPNIMLIFHATQDVRLFEHLNIAMKL